MLCGGDHSNHGLRLLKYSQYSIEFSSVPPVLELKSHQCSESCARFSPSPPLCLLLTPNVELVNISLDLLGYELQYLFLNTNSC